MELSKRCKDYWGFLPATQPFGRTIAAEDGVFGGEAWPEFEDAVEGLIAAFRRRQFAALVGAPCSAKSTAWSEAMRRDGKIIVCRPMCLDVSAYSESNVQRAVKEALRPSVEGDRSSAFARDREARARQVRKLLETANEAGASVCLACNDAHAARTSFLVMLKRMWDDLHGFDRLLSVVLIGHPSLLATAASIPEIGERLDVIRMQGLGDALADYIAHEWRRCCVDRAATPAVDESGMAELAKLRVRDRDGKVNWVTTRDHPLVVNNLLSRALDLAWRAKAQTISAEIIARAAQAESAMQ